MELFLLAAIIVVAVSAVAGRLGVAAPLVLVVVGVGLSFLPFAPDVAVEPEIILGGVLPPLLYAAAVALPSIDFRRDFAVISGLAVLLVIIGAVVMGLVFWRLLPGMSLAAGIAVGAVLSPTDAVATMIVKKVGAPSRIVTMLEGEGMLNDATALVLVHTAAAATIMAVSFGHMVGEFIWSVLAATVIGAGIGMVGLLARRRISSAPLTTAVSFIVPFVAYLLAGAAGASGLFAVVVTGLVTGRFAPRYLTARDRIFDYSIWQTVETVLTNGVFFIMGLELATIISDVHGNQNLLFVALGMAVFGWLLSLAIRAGYMFPLVAISQRSARRRAQASGKARRHYERLPAFVRTQLMRVADTDYLLARPITRPEGMLLVLAALRGVVTLAGAQSLPRAFPNRSFVVLLAFFVAAMSLLIQGTALPRICRRLGMDAAVALVARDSAEIHHNLEQEAVTFLDAPNLVTLAGFPYDPQVVARVRSQVIHSDDDNSELDFRAIAQHHSAYRELWVRTINSQRERILADNELGIYDSDALTEALAALDAEQMMVEMKPAAWLTEG